MSKLTIALGSFMGGSKDYCPDCGCDLKSNGACPECGYGEEDDMEEEGDEEGEMDMQVIMDIRDDLQKLVEKLGRLIAKD
jgi:predicted amidophosphoribosyltransferase